MNNDQFCSVSAAERGPLNPNNRPDPPIPSAEELLNWLELRDDWERVMIDIAADYIHQSLGLTERDPIEGWVEQWQDAQMEGPDCE